MTNKMTILISAALLVLPASAWAQSANQSITNSTHASITIKQYGNPGESAAGTIDSAIGKQSAPIAIDISQLSGGTKDALIANGQILNTLEGNKIDIRQAQGFDGTNSSNASAKIQNAGRGNEIKIYQRDLNNVALESASLGASQETSADVRIGSVEGGTPADTRNNKVFVDQTRVSGSIIDLLDNGDPLPTRHAAEVVIQDSSDSDILVTQTNLEESSTLYEIKNSVDVVGKITQSDAIQSLIDIESLFTFDADHTIKQTGDTNRIILDSQIAREQVLDIDQAGKDQEILIDISSTNKITKGEFIQKDANNLISFTAASSENIDAKIEQSGFHTSAAYVDIISQSDDVFLRLKQFDATAHLYVEKSKDITLNFDQERADLLADIIDSQKVNITANQRISEPVDITVNQSSNVVITSNQGNLPASFLTNF